MKNIFFALFIFSSLFTKAQNTDQDILRKNASNFLYAILHLDIEKAKSMGTEKTKTFLQDFPVSSVDEKTKKEMALIVVTIAAIEIEGNTALVHFSGSDNPDVEDILHFVKENGKWLVDENGETEPQSYQEDVIIEEE